MIDIRGRWILITGASRGIGYEAALMLADMGGNLILHSRDKRHTEGIFGRVREKGVNAIMIEADLGDVPGVEKLLREADESGVRIEFILNNAGIQTPYRKNFLKTPPEDFNECIQVNLIAPMMICYHFLPLMEEAGFGRIINTTSGIQYEAEQAAYSASKAALEKCTIDLGSKYMGTDIMINLVDPGWCRTDMGGEFAPNDAGDAMPGAILGAFIDDGKSGRIIKAQEYTGMNIEDAVNMFLKKQ